MVSADKRPTKKTNNYNIENDLGDIADSGQMASIAGDTQQIINIVPTGYAVPISRWSASNNTWVP